MVQPAAPLPLQSVSVVLPQFAKLQPARGLVAVTVTVPLEENVA